MSVDRARIEQLVPHAGAMCLLDSVTAWDAQHITCTAAAPSATHPLRRHGAVPALSAVEYAAQAAAVHGALLDPHAAPQPGMLAKLSDVVLHATDIPVDEGPLTVHAELLSRSSSGCLYAFDARCAQRAVVSGRLMVIFSDMPQGVR